MNDLLSINYISSSWLFINIHVIQYYGDFAWNKLIVSSEVDNWTPLHGAYHCNDIDQSEMTYSGVILITIYHNFPRTITPRVYTVCQFDQFVYIGILIYYLHTGIFAHGQVSKIIRIYDQD